MKKGNDAMKQSRKHSALEHMITIVLLILDVYIIGEYDLVDPFYLAFVFTFLNYCWFQRYFKRLRMKYQK